MYFNDEQPRVLLAKRHHAKDARLGMIIPVFEIQDKVLVPLTEHNFCPSMKVFITSNYEDIERRFEEDEIFKIEVRVTERETPDTDSNAFCKYVATGRNAERIKAKDYLQVIQHSLPDANNRLLHLDENLPGTQYIFIEDERYLYGPFKWTSSRDDENASEVTLSFVDTPLPNVKLIPYQMYRIDLSNPDVEEAITESSRTGIKLIDDLSILQTTSAVSYEDYASDDEIIRFCAKIASDFNTKLLEKKQVDTVVGLLNRNPKIKGEVYANRLARFAEIGGKVHEIKQDVIESLSLFFNTENGRKVISNYIEENEEAFLSKIRKSKEKEIESSLAERRAEQAEIEERIRELNETKSQLNIEVEKKRESVNSDESLQTAYLDTDKKIQEKLKEIEQLNAWIEEKQPLVKGIKDIEELTNEGKVLALLNQRTKEQRDALFEEVRSLKNECSSAEDELRKKLNNMRPYVDHITGGIIAHTLTERDVTVQPAYSPTAQSLVERQKEIIDLTKREMSQRGRHLPDWQVANLLISTQQSFITFMAGLPGVGKTSLARLLVEIQGLGRRSQEIAVARGWTAQKDLIGFYNPLSSRFQPSNTGLYNFLLALHQEKDSRNNPMAYVILDEANLSPIEHYWSSFMGMTDGNQGRDMILGDDTIHISHNLRFISTINYDGTTEPLSPRVVDRAPVIVLDPNEYDDEEEDVSAITHEAAFPLSSVQMDNLFGREAKAPELEDAELFIYRRIRDILRDPSLEYGRPVTISPRKEMAIRQYCGKARAVMREYQDLRALDVAMLQFVLPLVRGNGPNFAKRIERLKAELERAELLLSARYASRILAFGEEDLNTYDFFCW